MSAAGHAAAGTVPPPPRERVSRRARPYWALRALLLWVVVAGVEVAILVPGGSPRPVWVTVAAVSAVLALVHVAVMPVVRYRIHRWEQTPTGFSTQSGWLVVERRLAPLSRVQTVDVERGVLENLLGLATLTVTTASAAGPLKVPALDRATADRLADRLGSAAGTSRDDAT